MREGINFTVNDPTRLVCGLHKASTIAAQFRKRQCRGIRVMDTNEHAMDGGLGPAGRLVHVGVGR